MFGAVYNVCCTIASKASVLSLQVYCCYTLSLYSEYVQALVIMLYEVC